MVLLILTTCLILIIPTSIVLAETTVLDRPEEQPAENTDISALGNLYRKARQSRCIRCYEDRTYPYESRYGYSQYSSGGGGGGGIPPPSRGVPPYRADYDDKNWYPYPDRHDTRARYDDRYPERYGNRYDDRYSPRTYDRYDYRSNYDRYDTRGYEGRDRYYDRPNEGYYPDRYDRNRGGYEGRYSPDRDVYDRYPSRGGYDYKNYRPWDETYRGTSGFDNSGRGYYFAGRPNEQPTASHYRPLSPPSSPGPGQPYLPNSQSPPRPLQPPNSPPSSLSAPSSPSSSSQGSPPHHYQYSDRDRPPRPDDDPKGYAGGWSYVNDRDKKNDYNDDRNKDTQSPPYGPRPRPLGGSYLHDRDSNTPVTVQPMNTDGKTGEQPKDSGAGSMDNSKTPTATNDRKTN